MKSTLMNAGLLSFLALGLTMSSCKKEGCMDEKATNYDTEAEKDDGSCTYPEEGDVNIQFNYVFGSNMEDWAVGTTNTHPKTQDELTFSVFKFYVSRIKLIGTDGSEWSPEENYFLVCAGCPDASRIILEDVPTGEYTEIEFLLGLESNYHTNGPGEGDLAESEGMFWNQQDGYMMLMAEGSSPNAPEGSFTFHLGGYDGDFSILTEKRSDIFGESFTVDGIEVPVLNMQCNPARLWHSAPSVSVQPEVKEIGEAAQTMAKAFFENVTFTGVE